MKLTIRAPINIALIKYWGKRDEALLLPTKDSIGISLLELFTETSVAIINRKDDEIFVHDEPEVQARIIQGIQAYLHRFRSITGVDARFSIHTRNNFPTASGIASSASGFAALATGLAKASELNFQESQISALARLGSGSAARSVCGGFVRFYKGTQPDGSDSFGKTIFHSDHWPELRMIVVLTSLSPKSISSRDSAKLLVNNPLYARWCEESHLRVDAAIQAIGERNLIQLGLLMEKDWVDLQKILATCDPPIQYATEVTYNVIHEIHKLRENCPCYFTTDAGPHVKVLSLASNVPVIRERLKGVEGVVQIRECRLGPGAMEL